MEGKGLLGMINAVCEGIMRFATVNLLWILFTTVGLGIFGFMPASVAMFTVLRKWATGKWDIPIFKTFWQTYKNEFVKSNILGLILLLIGTVIWVDLIFLAGYDSLIFQFMQFLVVTVAIIFFLTVINCIPLYVYYQLKSRELIKNALFISLARPYRTAQMLLVSLIFVLFIIIAPIVSLFFTISLWGYSIMLISHRTMQKIEKLQEHME